MARTWLAALVMAPTVLLVACESSSGTATPAAPVTNTPTTAAPIGVSLPCQPGSGQQVTSSGPMNLTNLAGQQLSCAVFDHLTMNEVNLRDAQLAGAAFRSSTLNKVNFAGANLTGADFAASTLNFPDFAGADLRGAKLTDAHLNNPVWTGATCPDGSKAGDCATHLTPMSTVDGPATQAPQPTTTTSIVATTTTEAPPVAPKAPAVFNSPARGTYSCTGGTVAINGAGSDLHLVGECDLVTVNGAGSHVEIDAANRIIVNGAKAAVIYHNEAKVLVNGAGATAHRG